MEKSKIIDLILAFLAPIIHDNSIGKDTAPRITFLSENKVSIDLEPGSKASIEKTYESNQLAGILQQIVDYNIHNEAKDYLECLYMEDEESAERFDKDDIYDEEAVPGHIYHILRFIQNILPK